MIVYKPIAHIRAISFDLDDTLYDNMPYIYKAESKLATYMAEHYPQTQEISKHQWQKIKRKVLQEQPALINDISTFRSTVLTVGFMQTSMDVDLIPKAVSACYDYFYYQRSNFKVAKPVRKILKKLANKVPLAAITNGNVNLAAIGIEKYFSCIVHASPKYPMKPDPAMFEYVEKQLSIPAKNILHVGDDLHKDIKGAQDAGYQSAWFALDRAMNLTKENAVLLPHIQLSQLEDLKHLLKRQHDYAGI